MVVTSEALGILGGSCSPALPFNTPLDRASIPQRPWCIPQDGRIGPPIFVL